jgi:hypothetical protein
MTSHASRSSRRARLGPNGTRSFWFDVRCGATPLFLHKIVDALIFYT